MGISDLGIVAVIGPRRVAKPPASMATGSMNSLRMRQNGSATEVELQPHFAQSGVPHHRAETSFILGVQQEKSSSARANKFASNRSIRARKFIHFVDEAAAHSRRASFLML